MPFRVVSGVGRGVGVLDGVVIVEGKGVVSGVNLGQGTDVVRGGDALFPNYFGEDLLSSRTRLLFQCISTIISSSITSMY